MESHRRSPLFAAAALVIVIAGMKAAAPLLIPFLLALALAIVAAPALFALERKGLGTGSALSLVILGILLAGGLVTALAGSSLDNLIRDLPTYQERLRHDTGGLIDWAAGMGIEVSKARMLELLDPGAAMKLATSMLSGLGGVLTNAFLILLTVIFLLLEAAHLPAKLRAGMSDAQGSLDRFETIAAQVQHYVALKTATSLATGVLVTGFLALLGVDYAVLWGVLAFLLNFVPNIGSILAAVPAILIAYLQLGPSTARGASSGYLAINTVIGNVVEPKVMGQGLGLSTLVVFLSLVFWGWVLGPVGMLLSVPLTMVVKIALDAGESTRWLAIALGAGVAAQKSEPQG